LCIGGHEDSERDQDCRHESCYTGVCLCLRLVFVCVRIAVPKPLSLVGGCLFRQLSSYCRPRLVLPPGASINLSTTPALHPYMYDTYPPYLDQGLIQAVSTVSGPRYSRYSMYCISLYLDRGLIQLIQYVSDCIHAVSRPSRASRRDITHQRSCLTLCRPSTP